MIQPYFNVTTSDISMRVRTSLIPCNRRFYQEYSKKPDLYGPFWIMSTLVIILTIMHNLSTYLELPED